MSRRALRDRMRLQREASLVLVRRHVLLARTAPGRLMLEALGLAPERAPLDARPRLGRRLSHPSPLEAPFLTRVSGAQTRTCHLFVPPFGQFRDTSATGAQLA